MELFCTCLSVSALRLRTFNFVFLCLILLTTNCCNSVESLHLKGKWRTGDFFKFLTKFGFQKTNLGNKENTQGYIYGNITSSLNFTQPSTFAVLDRGYFLEFYGNRSVFVKEKACSLMLNKTSTIAYDAVCFDEGKEDFLRKVPCSKGELCPDEDRAENVISGYQFTYDIQDLKQPRFWYISLVACYRDVDCKWHHVTEDYELQYDFWIVNGNPYNQHQNPFEYQFSFDKQDMVEVYLVFFVCYLIMVPLQLYAVFRQKHAISQLFTASIVLELLGVFCNVIHVLKFVFDGEGVPELAITGDILDILSQTLFMLLLLLLAKGWAITRLELTWKPVVLAVWALYGIVHILLYVWNITEVDVIEDIDEYQTVPGWGILVFRTLIMLWFLYELRGTVMYEHNKQKLDFFLHFGASSLVWFIYLPIIALIALQISALWRSKLLLGITYSADCLAYAVMLHLLWPSHSEQYFLLAQDSDLGDELEEFNEAPHVLNSSQPQTPTEKGTKHDPYFMQTVTSSENGLKYARCLTKLPT